MLDELENFFFSDQLTKNYFHVFFLRSSIFELYRLKKIELKLVRQTIRISLVFFDRTNSRNTRTGNSKPRNTKTGIISNRLPKQ